MRGLSRIPGDGWLALLGGGELTFGETFDADEAWVAKAAPGPVGFIPAASGSDDYARHFGEYLKEELEREAELIPVYRGRDARRGRNAERIAAVPAVYLGGGVADHLLDALAGTPAAEALTRKLQTGGVVVAIAAAAQAAGRVVRSIAPGRLIPGFGWLPDGVIEPNFDPGHDRRLRKLLEQEGVRWGLGIPAESAVLLGPAGAVEVVGSAFYVEGPGGEMEVLEGPAFES
ncbi:MAG TPA: Type 1 glutamine amidotransferase-like domain-containing protein [Thermoanaerobaculia bacterium]|nr:Type 1 glutamine amidotransferase-like domain-containing protein [Thermoanaerobaculia bacterium]